MSVMSDIESQVLNRLEETDPPMFWDLQNEIRPLIVEALSEGMLISGDPELYVTTPITLVANSNVQPMPAGAVAILRLEAGPSGTIRKTSLIDLDRFLPYWEQDTGTAIDFWFPLGLMQFGIHPQLTTPQQAFISCIAAPVPSGRPYAGTEYVPFQKEFDAGFADCAASAARLKEGGDDFQAGMKSYDSFLDKMAEMSRFAFRKGLWRFSKSVGAQAAVTDVKVR